MWSRNLVNEEALAHWELSRQKQTKYELLFCRWNIKMAHGTNKTFLYSAHVLYETLSPTCRNMVFHTDCIFFFGATTPQCARASSFTRFLDHTKRHTTVGNTPLDEWSARRRDLYLKTHNIRKWQTSMPRWNSNPRSQPQTYVLDRAATGTGTDFI